MPNHKPRFHMARNKKHGAQHDIRARQAETIALDKIKKENIALRDAVRRRTVELEQKNRELEIEISLDRVRANANAMRTSDELSVLVALLFEELTRLDLVLARCIIWIIDPNTRAARLWMLNTEDKKSAKSYEVPELNHPYYKAILKGWKDRKSNWTYKLKGAEKRSIDKLLLKETQLSRLPKRVKAGILKTTQAFIHGSFHAFGFIEASGTQPLTQEQQAIVARFSKVFEQSYTRFLDLQKAEAQAREAKIEAALERVRARAMAMHSPDELQQVAYEMRIQFGLLGQPELETCAIHLYDESPDYFTSWAALRSPKSKGKIHQVSSRFPMHGPKIVEEALKNYRSGKRDYVLYLDRKILREWLSVLKKHAPDGYAIVLKSSRLTKPGKASGYWVVSDFSGGSLVAAILSEPNENSKLLLSRFANVFDLAYTRFVDLKQAEAQAREAQIEVAVERVRAKALAMHKSEEIIHVANALRVELDGLKIPGITSATITLQQENGNLRLWDITSVVESDDGFSFSMDIVFRLEGTKPDDWIRRVWDGTAPYFFFKQDSKDIKRTVAWIRRYKPEFAENAERWLSTNRIKNVWHPVATLSHGKLSLDLIQVPVNEVETILTKMGGAFDLAYKRFLDLQKAEAQAREAQIEVAVERVRAKALAMHKSEEIITVVRSLRQELENLRIPGVISTTIYLKQEDGRIRFWDLTTIDELNAGNHTMDKYLRLEECPDFLWFQRMFRSKEKYLMVDQDKEELKRSMAWIGKNVSEEVAESMIVFFEENNAWHMWHPRVLLEQGVMNIDFIQPPPAEVEPILIKMGAAFDLAHKRFLDLQKAEAQAREAQIEAALERVRGKSMAMHRSENLSEVIQVISNQLAQLGISFDFTNFVVNPTRDGWNLWHAVPGQPGPTRFFVPWFDHKMFRLIADALDNGVQFYTYTLTREEKNDFLQHVYKHIDPTNGIPQQLIGAEGMATSVCLLNNNAIGLSVGNFQAQPYTSEENSIFHRFGIAFEQAHTRFLDLQKAEAQAREAQIEAALERVRARSMAMHKSEEFPEVIQVVFEQFRQLNFKIDSAQFDISFRETDDFNLWTAVPGQPYPARQHIPYGNYAVFNSIKRAKEAGLDFISNQFTKEEKNEFFTYFFKHYPNVPEERKQFIFSSPGVFRSVVLLEKVALAIQNYSAIPYTDSEHVILKRFTKVFEQTYTRFLDLQKAEAQAREAQIEAALERVRSKTMAMHDSNDVGETVAALFAEFVQLGIHTNRCGIIIFADAEFAEVWTARSIPGEKSALIIGKLNLDAHELVHSAYVAWQAKQPTHRYDLIGESMVQYYDAINRSDFYPVKFDLHRLPAKEFHFDFFFPEGAVFAFVNDPIQDEHAKIMKRFAGVFGQTYRRYLDLQKAEAQAHEAQIEAALEKVRSRTMAMQHSSELTETSFLLVKQVLALGIKTWGCAFNIFDEDQPSSTEWFSNEQGYKSMYKIPRAGVFLKYYEAAQRGESLHVEEFKGQACIDHYLYLSTLPGLEEEMKIYAEQGVPLPTSQYDNVTFFKYGYLLFVTYEHVPKAHDIFKRFAKVFEQTYTRFLDLKRAEAQALEATKRASVDRVRAEIASMRTVQDLDRITPLIWSELKTLGVPFMRCGVFIMDESHRQIQTFLSTPEGKAISSFHLPYDAPGAFNEIVDHWTIKKIYTKHWGEAEFFSVADALVKQGSVANHEQYMSTVPSGVHLHCLPFLQGMLYVGNTEPLREDELQLAQSLADAFSTAYARYEDFSKLEAAKKQVDKTLIDLKQAQQQLVQSEKMASLGELTAGIAHEIQNPLNFVNNFSEVNKELLLEMEEAIQKGNYDEAIVLGKDIAANQEKINHHGKRAEGIVKGMLQHSRGSTGQKELTDINALCDEYLRLSYHGYRARDKSFNAKFETHLDDTIPKIEVMPQDIGRVVLNLINNAFYAVSEKLKVESKKPDSGYEPTVIVSTKHLDDKVEIRVSDNGNGIPDSIKEKIFQPFFTTKPTGQGTGLGLSLSYDIVKAHGGELGVETKENEGSEFIIQLPNV